MAETRSFEPPETLARTRADGPVLVAYASRNGATRGVAERIAERIGETGRTVESTPAAEVADLAGGGHLGDNRDWSAIDAWAGEIARSLRAA